MYTASSDIGGGNYVCSQSAARLCEVTTSSEEEADTHSATSNPIIDTRYYYSFEFNRLLLNLEQDPNNSEHWRDLHFLGESFVSDANLYGKVIIEECKLTFRKQKTITRNAEVGGVAGGEKFIIQGILFKFSKDVEVSPSSWLYGGRKRDDGLASKAAGQELLCANFLGSFSSLLRVPLMALVDYWGYRLVATALLPVSDTSLVYGSTDGGKNYTVKKRDIEKEVDRFGKLYHLKKHRVNSSGQDLSFSVCGDIEIHGCTFDSTQYYCLDAARVFPPQWEANHDSSNLRATNSIFYEKFRPEFMRQYEKGALNSDAFTKFTHPLEREQSIKDCTAATAFLKEDVIPQYLEKVMKPKFIAKLIDQTSRFYTFQWTSQDYIPNILILHMHKHGINIRFLGELFALIKRRRDAEADKQRHNRAYHGFKDLAHLRSVAFARTNSGQQLAPQQQQQHVANHSRSGEMQSRSSNTLSPRQMQSNDASRIRSGSAGPRVGSSVLSSKQQPQKAVSVNGNGISSANLLAKSMPNSLSGSPPLPPSLSAPMIEPSKKRTLPNAKQIQQQQLQREGSQNDLNAHNNNNSNKMASTSSFWALTRDEKSADGEDDDLDGEPMPDNGSDLESYNYLLKFIANMMAIRVIKNEIRRRLRTEIKSKREYGELMVRYMNLMTCGQPQAEQFWTDAVNDLVTAKFFPPRPTQRKSTTTTTTTSNTGIAPTLAGSDGGADHSNNLLDSEPLQFRMLDYGLHQGFVFLSICQVMGIILLPKTFEVFQAQYHSAMHMCFGIFDIQEIRPTVKYLNYIDLATGMYVYHLCLEKSNDNSTSAVSQPGNLATLSRSREDTISTLNNNNNSNSAMKQPAKSDSGSLPALSSNSRLQQFKIDPTSDTRLLSTYSQKSYYRFLCVCASWSNLTAQVLPENFFQFRKHVRELNRRLQHQFLSSKSRHAGSLSSSAENVSHQSASHSSAQNAASFFRFNNKSGFLDKEGEMLSIFKKRYFVIEANYGRISYYEYDDKTEKKGEIAFAAIRDVREVPDYQQKKFVFGVWTVHGRVYYLRGSDDDNVKRWIEAILETAKDVNTFSSGNSGNTLSKTLSTKY